MQKNLIVKLRTNLNFLTKVEKRIAGLILENPSEFITYSLEELAEKAEVSQGSIINFSKKYAGGGFPELKLQLSACFAYLSEENNGNITASETVKDIMSNNINSCNNAYRNTLAVNEENALKNAAELIMKAKKVEIYGIYRSAAVATDFCYQLLEFGIPASFVSDILTCSVSATMLQKEDVVIAISSSGKTKDIIDAVNNAKRNKVPVISVTSNINSPLARLSDEVLIASPSGNSVSNSSSEIRNAQLMLLDSICSFIRQKEEKTDKNRFIELKKILESHSVEETENE